MSLIITLKLAKGATRDDAFALADACKATIIEEPREEPEVLWGQHYLHNRAEWKHEVANGDTNLGYWDWVEHQKVIMKHGD